FRPHRSPAAQGSREYALRSLPERHSLHPICRNLQKLKSAIFVSKRCSLTWNRRASRGFHDSSETTYGSDRKLRCCSTAFTKNSRSGVSSSGSRLGSTETSTRIFRNSGYL